MKTKIVTARINEQIGFEIEYLKRHLNVQSTTQVITEAVTNLYTYVKEKKSQKTPFELLEELHLIGCFEGEKGLSQTYKEEISNSLSKKYRPNKLKKKKKN